MLEERHADPFQEAVRPRSASTRVEKVLKTFIRRSRAEAVEEGRQRAAFALHSSTGLGQVQFKCDGKGVTGAIHLIWSCFVVLWASAPPETAGCPLRSVAWHPATLMCPGSSCFNPLTLAFSLCSQRVELEKKAAPKAAWLPAPVLASSCAAAGPWGVPVASPALSSQHRKLSCPVHPSLAWGHPAPQTGLPVGPRPLPAKSAAGGDLIKQLWLSRQSSSVLLIFALMALSGESVGTFFPAAPLPS